jgi:hypothetical protein
MYAIVEFEKDETEMVPLSWIADGTPATEINPGMKKPVKFYWPPTKSIQVVSKALKNCTPSETNWPIHQSVRIFATANKHHFYLYINQPTH